MYDTHRVFIVLLKNTILFLCKTNAFFLHEEISLTYVRASTHIPKNTKHFRNSLSYNMCDKGKCGTVLNYFAYLLDMTLNRNFNNL